MMSTLLTGRTVLVVGAAGGVGEGITRALLSADATVVAASRTKERLDALSEMLSDAGPGTLNQLVFDINDPDSGALTRHLVNAFGLLDGAVVAIGDWGTAGRRSIMETSNETWDAMIAANQTSQFRAFKSLVPALQSTGALVNLSGLSAEIPYPGSALIAATNAANKSLARTLAVELAQDGPRIYELILSVIRTRPRRESGIDNEDWYRAEDVGDHAARLIAGVGPFVNEPLQYLMGPKTGIQTATPAL